MRAGRPFRVVGIALLAVAGCTSAGALDVGYPPAAVNQALLASAPPRRIQVAPVVDRRMDPTRIGVTPKDKPLVTSRPVTEIVQDALVSELDKNGHTVVTDQPDVVLATAVEAFGLDSVEGYPGRQYVGKVVLAMSLSDGRAGAPLLTRRYVGIRRQQVSDAGEREWLEIMNTALSRVMHDVATDSDLVAALGSATADRAR